MERRKPDAERKDVVITVKVTPPTYGALRRLAREDDRTLSGYLRRVMDQHVEQTEHAE